MNISRGIACLAFAAASAAFAAADGDVLARLQQAKNGETVVIPPGVYDVVRPIDVAGKTNLTVRGGTGVVFRLRFDPTNLSDPAVDGFRFRDCAGVAVEGLTMTTDRPVNCSGRVAAVDPEAGWYEVQVEPEFPVTGRERLQASETFDEHGVPDYVLEEWAWTGDRSAPGLAYELVAPQRLRVRTKMPRQLPKLKIGQSILFRYWIYGNSVFRFDGCSDCALRDIKIERSASMAIRVHARSRNFTLERVYIRPPKGSAALFSGNADGINVTGLAGKLTVSDCHIRGLGDDAINVHCPATCVIGFDAATGRLRMQRVFRTKPVKMGPLWAARGDVLAVYDPKTLAEIGRLRVKDYVESEAVVEVVSGRAEPGSVVFNDSMRPEILLRNCSFEISRARGVLLRSRDMTVENCRFFGHALPGILITPDFRYWFEAGPSRNVVIRNCVFERCCNIRRKDNLGAVAVKCSDEGGVQRLEPGVHRNIVIRDNLFLNCGSRGIFVASTLGVDVAGNRFEGNLPPQDDSPRDVDVRLLNCR